MKIYPIATNTFNNHRTVMFNGNPDTVMKPVPTEDITQFNRVHGGGKGLNHKKGHSKSFVNKLNEFFTPLDTDLDPRYSESPWIRSFLY